MPLFESATVLILEVTQRDSPQLCSYFCTINSFPNRIEILILESDINACFSWQKWILFFSRTFTAKSPTWNFSFWIQNVAWPAISTISHTDIDCFSTSEFFVHKALMSFPNGSSAGLDGISPQILKNFAANSNGQTGLNFFRALTNLVNVILEGKVPFELRPYFFGAKLIVLN